MTQNTIVINDKKSNNTDLIELLVQKPNSKTLGLPLSLYFYNLGDNNKPKKASDWGTLKPKTYNFIKNVFSEKQSISFANSMIRLNNWFLKNGQAPITIDDKKIKKTKAKIQSQRVVAANKYFGFSLWAASTYAM